MIEVIDDGEGFDPAARRRATASSPRAASASRSSARSPTSSRSSSGEGGGSRLRFVKFLTIARPYPTRSRRRLLQLVNVGHKSLVDYGSHRDARADGRDPPARRAARGQAGAAPLRDGVRGGVAEINYTLVPLMQDAGLEVEWRIIRGADDFFNVDEDDPQRAAGQPARADAGAAGDLPPLPGAERARFRRTTTTSSSSTTRSRPAIIDHFPDVEGALDLARAHRLLDAEPDVLDVPAAVDRALRRDDLPPARVRAARDRAAAGVHLAAGDRPARAEEHGALARGRGVHRRPVRHRRRAAAAHAGLALRSVEGPARRDRRVPAREGRDSRGAARARRLDGARRSGGLGLLQPHRRATRPAIPTSTSSRTSTTSARSRSTRSRCTRAP